jgi:outer membrane protein
MPMLKWQKILTTGLLALALSPISAVAAEYKIAFVEVPRLLRDAPQVEAVRDKLKKEFSRRNDDLVAQQEQMVKLEEKLRRDATIMSDAESKRLERDIISRQRKLKSSQTEFQEDLALRQNEELGKLRKVIGEIIVQVAKDGKFDLVLESGVVYASERANITDQVLERLKQQN